MATEASFMDYLAEQMSAAGDITYRKMFGEYALYCEGIVVALVCDNQLYIKPTSSGRSMIGNPVEAQPYPGAKPYFRIEDRLDDREWMGRLIRLTAAELPQSTTPTRKKKRSPG